MPRKTPRITFAPSTTIDALRPYVDEALEIIARVLDRESVMGAWCTDESDLWCFLETVETGELRPSRHPRRKGEMCKVVTADTPELGAWSPKGFGVQVLLVP